MPVILSRNVVEAKNLLPTQVEKMLRLRFTPLSMTKPQICVTSFLKKEYPP